MLHANGLVCYLYVYLHVHVIPYLQVTCVYPVTSTTHAHTCVNINSEQHRSNHTSTCQQPHYSTCQQPHQHMLQQSHQFMQATILAHVYMCNIAFKQQPATVPSSYSFNIIYIAIVELIHIIQDHASLNRNYVLLLKFKNNFLAYLYVAKFNYNNNIQLYTQMSKS